MEPRFISKGETAFKIQIHAPHDELVCRSVGFIKIGENKARREAVKLRNKLGRELWGKFWPRVLKEEDLFLRLTHSLEPIDMGDYYQAMWSDKKGVRHCRKRSIEAHGRLAAYTQCKKAILDAHSEEIELLRFMGRLSTIDLK